MSAAAVDLENLIFRWPGGPTVLNIERFVLASGDRVFLQGPSGSGKSTLLGVIAGVLAANAGRVDVLGADFGHLSGAARDAIRAEQIGVIFQMFNLLPYLSVLDNVMLPCRFSPARAAAARARGRSVEREATRLLARLGLTDPQILKTPSRRLSVGQQQRVAAARALIGAPALIIADEPTSALDASTRDAFLALLLEECAQTGASLLFVSHDASLAGRFDQALDLGALNRAMAAEQAA